MLDTAKGYIDDLNEIVDKIGPHSLSYVDAFNDKLMSLFKTIPRKMNRVNEYLLHTNEQKEALKIIDREQKLYDVLLANFQT